MKLQDSIFGENLSIERTQSKWEDRLYDLVDVQTVEHKGREMMFKRGDFFAPLGYGGINGDKLRVAIHIMLSHLRRGGAPLLSHGTVMGSPQSPMAAAVARHYGCNTITVLGGTRADTCIKQDTIKMTAWFGSEFAFAGNGYNNTIQPMVKRILASLNPNGLYLEYGITLDHHVHSAEDITAFHSVGAGQVLNIPENTERLIIPFGSANSGTSILFGLAKYRSQLAANLKEIILIGIGPNRVKFLKERLSIMGLYAGIDTDIFDITETHNPDRTGFNLSDFLGGNSQSKGAFKVTHYDLHNTKYVAYNDLMPYNWGGIELHPRYEGKVMTYLEDLHPELIGPNSLFWIIGSKPSIEPMIASIGDEISSFIPDRVQVLHTT